MVAGLKRFVKRKLQGKPYFPVRPEHSIEFAFSVDGIDYYCFSDTFNIPAYRAWAALDFYRELSMGVDKEFLQWHTEAVNEEFNNGNFARIVELNSQLRERTQTIANTELLYKLCSVLYFDENENPYDFSFEYAYKKIDRWKKYQDALAFFLRTGVMDLVPLPDTSKVDFRSYLQAENLNHRKSLGEILQTLYSKDKNSASSQNIISRMESLASTQFLADSE